jgi:hypothetical protein
MKSRPQGSWALPLADLRHLHLIRPDDAQITITCDSGRQGAILSLPFEADREETIARGDFGEWIVKNIDDCLEFANGQGYSVGRTEDIMLVTGRHLARSWVSVAFPAGHREARVSFRRISRRSGVHFVKQDDIGGELKLGPSGEVGLHCL